MNNIDTKKIKNKIISEKTWKKKGMNIKPKEIGTPESYTYQFTILDKCFEKLKYRIEEIKKNKYRYIEIDFFKQASELRDYFNILKENGLSYIDQKGNSNRIYFYIDDIDLVIKYLNINLENLKRYIEGSLSKDSYSNKQIIMWRSFYINTEKVKYQIIDYVKDYKRLRINYNINEEKKIEVEEYIDNISKIYGKITVDVECGVIDLSELENGGHLEIKDFIKKLSLFDDILSINLDSYFSESDGPNGRSPEIKVKVNTPTGDLPIVAVIDSGVKRNLLTESVLLEEGLDYTGDDDAFNDTTGHGTMVANQIIYGDTLHKYFLDPEYNEEYLIPLINIFSVKVLKDKEGFIDYEEILKDDGDFIKALKKYNIKIVNLSINETTPKDFNETGISKNASIIDKFSTKHGIIFVICTGNIEEAEFTSLKATYPNLEFYNKGFNGSSKLVDKYINISSPGDQLSGITVGGSHLHEGACHREQYKCFSTSLVSRGYNGNKRFTKPDVLSVGSGDYLLYRESDGNLNVEYSHTHKTCHIGLYENRMHLANGTSFSAPRVSRALAIGAFKYDDYSIETIKGLFLHNIHLKSKHKNYVYNKENLKYEKGDSIEIPKYMGGLGVHEGKNEELLFSDNENKVTYILEGKVKSRRLIEYEVPIVKLLGDGTNSKKNKLRLKLSITSMPTNNSVDNKNVSLEKANEFFISGALHKKGFEILDSDSKCKNKKIEDKIIKEIFVNWTNHYYNDYNRTYSESSTNIVKDEMLEILGEDDTIVLSVRGFNKDNNREEKQFTAIFSIEDLGATNEINNDINLEITI